MAQVSIRGITKIFPNAAKAVDNLTLEVENKEFMVLVGPSGCGKSTTLRIIAGLEEATAGDVFIAGTPVNDVPAKDRDIAMVFQTYALYPHMTAFENMAFGLKLRHYPGNEIVQRVNEAAEILNIRHLLDRKPGELSGGEKQRVAVGRAIVRKPKVFLFDEPLSNLDAKLRAQMRLEINKLHTRLAATIIYVTHDQVEAMTMGDRVAVMRSGVIQQVGDPIAIYDHPKNKFVAGFIGSPAMNFLDGRIIQKNGKLYFLEGRVQVKLVDDMAAEMGGFAGKEVTLGIRCEDIYDKLFVSEAPPENIVRVTCEVVEPMGSEVYLHLNTGSNTFVARVGAHDRPQVNADIDMVFDMSKAHFFDKNTEEAIC